MRKESMHRSILLSCLFLLTNFISSAAAEDQPIPQESKQVVSTGRTVGVRVGSQQVSPDNLKVKPGAKVVWQNSAEQNVRVRFTSNAVSTTCEAPRGFNIGAKGIFESDAIASGDVASICLLEPHVYTYEIDYLVPKVEDPANGKKKKQKWEVVGTKSGKIEVK
jgi:hypothetical protein